jgi:SM-20-related protein
MHALHSQTLPMQPDAGTRAGKPFAYLNEDAIRAAVLQHAPYDYAFVPDAIEERFKEEILLDAPVIPHRGSYGLPSLRRGAKFEAVIL